MILIKKLSGLVVVFALCGSATALAFDAESLYGRTIISEVEGALRDDHHHTLGFNF